MTTHRFVPTAWHHVLATLPPALSEVTIAKAIQGRVRAFGRVWDFDGRSGEICPIDWKGPVA